MQVQILHPVHHGTGRGKTTVYGRGLYQTDDAKAENYLAPNLAAEFLKLKDPHNNEPIVREYEPPAPAKGKAEKAERPETRK
jgi:hypothetical protein